VQPRPTDALTGLDEQLVRVYRQTPGRVIGQRIAPQVTAMLAGEVQYAAVQQLVRDAGFILWELELERPADSIGI
jgi:hypothetical protein